MRDAVRVALLARPGAGGDRLREALRAAGADLVLDADPTTLAPETLAGAGAESVVVVLDAAVEEALDRLDPVLHDPAIDVLYEESEVAAAREGWDVARWTRHLSAKLLRHGDVLPPGREADAEAARPRAAAGPAPIAGDAPGPEVEEALAPPVQPVTATPSGPPATSMFDPVSAEYDPTVEADEAAPETAGPAAPPAEPDWGNLELAAEDVAEPATPTPAEPPLTLAADDATSRTGRQVDPAPSLPPAAPVAEQRPEPAAAAPRSDAIRDFRRDLAGIEQRIASMGLVDVDPPAASGTPAPAAEADAPVEPATGTTEPETSEPRASATAAPGDAAPTQAAGAVSAAGAVLVFAGIGGPDAVRQFLGALPDGFPRAVLIHQRLDGGRHDRLVQQMARATSLPVQLAADTEAVVAGHVYIMPPGLGLGGDAAGLRFAAGGDPLASLPAGESAVLMFSGSDTALVDAAMGHARAGALVAGQSPEDCYDAAAADALVARGAESGQPADLARRLAERWAA